MVASTGPVVAAAIQTEPALGDVVGNLADQRAAITTAAAGGARLVVLPECSTTGYCFESVDEAAAIAEDVGCGDGPAMTTWQALAADHGLHIAAGIVEREATRLYNAAVLVGPDGLVGRYRKTHLWGIERGIYTPGDLGFGVFDTPIGRIGMQICYDGWFPEVARLEALQGADIVCVPANWVPVPTQDPSVPAMADMLCMTSAHTNLVYVVAASRVGVERGQRFIGSSIIVDHSGAPLAGPASTTDAEILTATIDPIGSRAERHGNPFNQPLRDRRADLYAEMLGAVHQPGDY
jgi:predicted amidohydrolase